MTLQERKIVALKRQVKHLQQLARTRKKANPWGVKANVRPTTEQPMNPAGRARLLQTLDRLPAPPEQGALRFDWAEAEAIAQHPQRQGF